MVLIPFRFISFRFISFHFVSFHFISLFRFRKGPPHTMSFVFEMSASRLNNAGQPLKQRLPMTQPIPKRSETIFYYIKTILEWC